MSMKKSNDTIGNRTRDLPTGSAVHVMCAKIKCIHSYISLYLQTTSHQLMK